jgi:hypothetical protein
MIAGPLGKASQSLLLRHSRCFLVAWRSLSEYPASWACAFRELGVQRLVTRRKWRSCWAAARKAGALSEASRDGQARAASRRCPTVLFLRATQKKLVSLCPLDINRSTSLELDQHQPAKLDSSASNRRDNYTPFLTASTRDLVFSTPRSVPA